MSAALISQSSVTITIIIILLAEWAPFPTIIIIIIINNNFFVILVHSPLCGRVRRLSFKLIFFFSLSLHHAEVGDAPSRTAAAAQRNKHGVVTRRQTAVRAGERVPVPGPSHPGPSHRSQCVGSVSGNMEQPSVLCSEPRVERPRPQPVVIQGRCGPGVAIQTIMPLALAAGQDVCV
ncbi:unnamed protein product [Pleuronectes platessa]|uniref:Uncharacterized protein n=1 Tax=Pleuronectes platessa TaxID=8262 RepID=A0A9N7VVM4_PLEPL|nr:unnamed protein product [Pleuronectes platessa]